MKNEAEVLRKENAASSQQLTEENNQIYTNICVYIRSFSCSDYQQEIVCRDILRMMLDGQARGASMQEIIGDDVQEFCNAVYAEIPKSTKPMQMLSILDTLCYCVALLFGIWLVFGVIDNMTAQQAITKVAVTSGDIISFVLILMTAFAFIKYTSEHAFTIEHKKTMICLAFCVIVIIMVNITMQQTLFHVSIYLGFVIACACYLLHKGIERYLSKF